MLDQSRGLLDHLEVFGEWLKQAGYSPLTAREKLSLMCMEVPNGELINVLRPFVQTTRVAA